MIGASKDTGRAVDLSNRSEPGKRARAVVLSVAAALVAPTLDSQLQEYTKHVTVVMYSSNLRLKITSMLKTCRRAEAW